MQAASAYHLLEPVFLVGFMGAGKSTVARLLERTHGLSWADADACVEQLAGRSIPQIFADQGEAAFRDLETRALRQLAQDPPRIIACGGGVVERPQNIQLMDDAGFAIYLQVAPQQAVSRISDASTRPLFGDPQAAAALLQRRIPLYEQCAKAAVDTNGQTPRQVADQVASILCEAGLLEYEV